MREAVIVASSRTALAKSHRGSFNMIRPDDLAAHTIRHVLGKVPQLDPIEVEDVILGCGEPHGPQGRRDLWELNEAFVSQVIYCRDRLASRWTS